MQNVSRCVLVANKAFFANMPCNAERNCALVSAFPCIMGSTIAKVEHIRKAAVLVSPYCGVRHLHALELGPAAVVSEIQIVPRAAPPPVGQLE